jgi:hypothetical protein
MLGLIPIASAPLADDASLSASVILSGVEATGQLGTAAVYAEAIVSPTGVQGTGTIGSVSIKADANVLVTGVAATGDTGSVTVDLRTRTDPAGVEATGQLGSVAITAEAVVNLTGVEGVTALGNTAVEADGAIEVIGNAATGEVGTVIAVASAIVAVTGVSAEASTLNRGTTFTADGAAQLSTAQAKFGSASLLLDGTNDFVTSDESIDLSSGDFTVDLWIRPTNVTGYKGIWQTGTSTTEQSYLLGNQVYWSVNPSTIISSSVTVSAGVWTMLSYEREGNVHRIYKNGTLEDTFTTANRPDSGVFSVGKNGFGDFNGYIDEVRLSSVARYEGTSFTEPVAEYEVDRDTTALLHFDGTNGSTDIINETAGNATVEADANVNATGLEATGELGNISLVTNNIINVTGVQGTTALGTATVEADANVNVTGVQGTTALGETTETGAATVYAIGVQGTGRAGNVLVWGQIVPNQNANWTEIAA